MGVMAKAILSDFSLQDRSFERFEVLDMDDCAGSACSNFLITASLKQVMNCLSRKNNRQVRLLIHWVSPIRG